MTVNIIFKGNNGASHTGQAFEITSWEVHTYNFLELVFVDGTVQMFNMNDIFSFQIPVAANVTGKKK